MAWPSCTGRRCVSPTMADRERLRHLAGAFTAIPGISGHEDAMASAFVRALVDWTAEARIDGLANAIVRLRGERAAGGARIALMAHLDTVGLQVKRRNPDGTLGVVRVGGLNLKAAPGAAMRIGGRNGLIGVRSQHLARAGEGIPDQDDLYVEIGAGELPPIATSITYAPQIIEMDGGYVASPYLDDRAGCAALVELARLLAGRTPHEIILVGSAQEETTSAGAQAALGALQPDAVIAVDGTLSYDTPDTRGRGEVALGRGPVLVDFLYVSGMNGWHAHPRLSAHLAATAAAKGIAIQRDVVYGLISDARAALPSAIPSVLVGVPMRGKHGPLETMHWDDLAGAVDLLEAALTVPLPPLARGED